MCSQSPTVIGLENLDDRRIKASTGKVEHLVYKNTPRARNNYMLGISFKSLSGWVPTRAHVGHVSWLSTRTSKWSLSRAVQDCCAATPAALLPWVWMVFLRCTAVQLFSWR